MVAKLKRQLPEPLQRVLGSTGLNITQPGAYTNPQGLSAIASVDPSSVNTVEVNDPKQFISGGAQTLGHESTHLWQNNLPPTVQAKIPADGKYPGQFADSEVKAMRAQGKTLSTIPRENAATIIQQFIAKGGTNAPPSVQKIYAPWAQDMATTPLSSIIPTQPGQPMSVTPRPPLPIF
jgi:hypothetical protein